MSMARHYADIHQENVSSIDVGIKCHHLVGNDIHSEVTSMVVIYEEKDGHSNELGRTEMIKKCRNPEFSTHVEIEYRFEEVQNLKFRIYSGGKVSEDTFLGGVDCTVGQLVSSTPYTRRLLFDNGAFAGDGTITIFVEELTGNKAQLQFKFSATGLDNKDLLSPSDPYMDVYKRLSCDSWGLLHRTEVKKNTLSPSWEPFSICKNALVYNNYSGEIKLCVRDYDGSGRSEPIGETTVDVGDLLKPTDIPLEWPCVNLQMLKKKGEMYTKSGIIILDYCKLVADNTFLDYIFGGLEICFTVGIDFTASNGPPDNCHSLHYTDPSNPNEYQRAITSLGNVIQHYSSDKKFVAMGFGARVPPRMEVSHKFPLNLDEVNPTCMGVEGIMNAYKTCLGKLQLNGPTIVAPVINHVASLAELAHNQTKPTNYYILLILTDGAFTDMDEVTTSIVNASRLPMSIVIVGVGNGDFGGMTLLDSDNNLLKASDGSASVRDIVQFVPFRQYQNAPSTIFAKEVLAEVPRQITEYYKQTNKPPLPSKFAAKLREIHC